ncbi:MAG TPA: oxidoreductase, partial [Candidatus Nanopelagicales bacterium]|nr:oxidoreductase [Candidatus Nanopelagicales bacterium]
TRTALVTGASSGIGAATAAQLVQTGFTVFGAGRRVERIEQIPGVTAIGLDITEDDQIRAMVDRVMEQTGRIDVLVNNAGYGQYGTVEDTSIDTARHQFEVNMFGLASLTQLVIPPMRAQGDGTIVNISSMGGRMYTPLGAWYHATKHALEGWSDCLRMELRSMGIKVVIVEPGIIATEFTDVVAGNFAMSSDPYSDVVSKVTSTMNDPKLQAKASSPDLVAKTVMQAVNAKKPKQRYAVGYLAKPLLGLRRLGGDRLFDRALASIYS